MDVVHARVRQEDWACDKPIACPLYAERRPKGPRDDVGRPEVGNLRVFVLAFGSSLNPPVDFRRDLGDQWPSICEDLRSPEGFDGDTMQAV
jgi:hypothetical protein